MTVREGDAVSVETAVQFYVRTVNNADAALGANIWHTGPKSTLIHPRSEDVGWDEIRKNFYEHRLGTLYTERDFKIKDLHIEVWRNTAVAFFYWDFDGKLRSDGTAIHHEGRTSLVFNRAGQGWKLFHAHVSGLQITSEREDI